MDEKELNVNKGDELPKEDRVFRIVVSTHRDRRNNAIPGVSCFDLNKNDGNKLSVDWEGMTTPEECLVRVGTSFKFNKEEYKSYDNREIYALKIDFLNRLKDIEEVIYDPIIHTSQKKGSPDNPAHPLIVFQLSFLKDKSRRPETILKIRDHAKDKKVKVNMEEVERLVEEYKGSQDNG